MWANRLVLIVAWCLWPVPLNAAEPTRAQRTCTDEEHRVLKQEVGRACKATSMRCNESQSCGELLANWLRFQRCINARVAVMNKCFQGGDATHHGEVDNARAGADNCSNHMTAMRCPQKCQ